MAPQKQWLSEKMVETEGSFRTRMKNQSAKVPALKDILDRPLDLGCLELIEQTLSDAGISARWMFLLHKAFRSLKSYGSSPEHMMDLLSLLHESSDENVQKMDLDDISVQHVTAGRSALGKVIELARKKGKNWKGQGTPWLRFMPMKWPCESSVSMLQALDARASILMTRLDAVQKKSDTCQEASLEITAPMAPQKQWLSEKMVETEGSFRKRMKNQSAKAPALKDILDRPLDLGCLELIEQTLSDAGISARWMFLLHKAFRSLKSYGSSPEHMMDLLSLLHESSDENVQKMDLDGIKVQHLTAGRSALGKVIELARKKGKNWKCQGTPWLRFMPMKWPCESSVSMLQALDARASILMTRLDAVQKKSDTCQEASLQTKQDEFHMQSHQLTHECERLQQEESKRQAIALQMQQLQLESDNFLAAAHALKSKVDTLCNAFEKCDADVASQPDWELCTVMTEGSGISVDTAGRCFMKEAVFKAAHGGFVRGQDLRKGSKILAADGSIVGVAHPPEVSEKRGKVVLRTDKAKLEVTADHRVVNVTREGAQRQVPAFKLSVGDLVVVDNETTSLTRVDFDPATFKVLKIGFFPDKPVEAFSLQPTIQSHGHKMTRIHRGGRRTRREGEDDISIPDTQGYYSD